MKHRPRAALAVVTNKRRRLKQGVVGGIVALGLYVIIPQMGAFHNSFHLLQHIAIRWLVLATGCYLLTGIVGAVLYMTLAPRRLPLGRTVTVQYASSFANRLLPAGIGTLGVGYLYLRKRHCTAAQAIALLTCNNFLGLLGHGLLLVGVFVVMPQTFHGIHVSFHVDMMVIALLAVVVAIICVLALYVRRVRSRMAKLVASAGQQLLAYRARPLRIIVALGVSVCITLLYATCLWASGQALGADFTIAAAIIVLAVGVGLGAVVPLPGGLGGAEAGLVAGMIALGVPAASAVAVAILYRLITYWLGFVVGGAAFAYCRQRTYF